MPEAITYNDMRRRIVGAFPDPIDVKLRILPANFGHLPARKGEAKVSCLSLGPLEKNKLKDNSVINQATILRLDSRRVVNHGKQLFIPLKDYGAGGIFGAKHTLWMRVACTLHGHVLPVTASEGKELMNSSVGKPPFALVVLENCSPLTKRSSHSLAVVDRNRLTQVSFFELKSDQEITLNATHTPNLCTMTQPDLWANMLNSHQWNNNLRSSIFTFIINHQNFFCGVGTSHASEILHLAKEHPGTVASQIMTSDYRRNGLINAVKAFYARGQSQLYFDNVPARSSSSGFYESTSISTFYNQRFHEVYGKTATGTLIPTEDYDQYIREDRISARYKVSTAKVDNRVPKPTKNKRVDVYAVRLGKTRGIAYTIFKIPFPRPSKKILHEEATELSYAQAFSKSTTGKGNRAEIGIASFMDTKSVEAAERESNFRRIPFRDGLPGRPRMSKIFRLCEDKAPGDFIRRQAGSLSRARADDVTNEGAREVVDVREEEYLDHIEGQDENGRSLSLQPIAALGGSLASDQAHNFLIEQRALRSRGQQVNYGDNLDAVEANAEDLEMAGF